MLRSIVEAIVDSIQNIPTRDRFLAHVQAVSNPDPRAEWEFLHWMTRGYCFHCEPALKVFETKAAGRPVEEQQLRQAIVAAHIHNPKTISDLLRTNDAYQAVYLIIDGRLDVARTFSEKFIEVLNHEF